MLFQVDHRDDTGYGMTMTKNLGDPYIHLIKEDPYESRTIRLDFNVLCGMVDDIRKAEKKELNKRIILGIKND